MSLPDKEGPTRVWRGWGKRWQEVGKGHSLGLKHAVRVFTFLLCHLLRQAKARVALDRT